MTTTHHAREDFVELAPLDPSVHLKPISKATPGRVWSDGTPRRFVVVALGLAAWALVLTDMFSETISFAEMGIKPGTLEGLAAVLYAPLLHVDMPHLLLNTVPFLLLGWLAMLDDFKGMLMASIMGGLAVGLGAWLFSDAEVYRVGLDGIIFAFAGFLMARSWFEGTRSSLVLPLLVAACYGMLLWSVMPVAVEVYAITGFLGLFAGGAAAFFCADKIRA